LSRAIPYFSWQEEGGMRIDLFELIDGLFRGIVYFLYNLLETAYRVLRHPMRAPALLWRAHRTEGKRQVGGLTFLFVTYFAVFGALDWLVSGGMGETLLPELTGVLGGSFDTAWWWNVFLASLASTVFVDSVLRIVLRIRFRARRRRAELLAKTEYALFLPAVLVTPVAALAGIFWVNIYLIGSDISGLASAIPVVAFALALCGPAAAQYWARPAPLRRRFRQGLALGALISAGSALGLAVGALRLSDEYYRGNRIEVVRLDCRLLEDRPFVDVLLTNRAGRVVAVDPAEAAFYVGPVVMSPIVRGWVGVSDTPPLPLRAGEDAYGSATLIGPGDTRLVRGWLTVPAPPGLTAGTQCMLIGSASGVQISGEPGRVAEPTGRSPGLPAPAR
jgi:hypothetical protein